MNDPSLEIWRRMCRCRAFDNECEIKIRESKVKTFTYLSAGQEAIAAAVSVVFAGAHVFPQHRNHSAYISFGGDVKKLRDELLGLRTGTTNGMGGDPCHHDPEAKIWGHCGLVGDQAAVAVGYSFGTGQRVVCFAGDATPEEGYFWDAVGFAASKLLPVLFVIEDNGLSVLTEKETRRAWSATNVARGYGLLTCKESDDPFALVRILDVWKAPRMLPAYISVETIRKYRHVGWGFDAKNQFDRMDWMRQEFLTQSPSLWTEALLIEADAVQEMKELWKVG